MPPDVITSGSIASRPLYGATTGPPESTHGPNGDELVSTPIAGPPATVPDAA